MKKFVSVIGILGLVFGWANFAFCGIVTVDWNYNGLYDHSGWSECLSCGW